MTFTIRDATPDDADGIATVNAAAWKRRLALRNRPQADVNDVRQLR